MTQLHQCVLLVSFEEQMLPLVVTLGGFGQLEQWQIATTEDVDQQVAQADQVVLSTC